MGLEFLRRTELETLAVGLVAGLVAWMLGHPAVGAGLLVGAAWGAANLWAFSTLLLREVKRRATGGPLRSVLPWALVKFPLLYGGGYLILRWGRMPAASLLGGFSLLFFVWFAEATWRSTSGSARGEGSAAP